MVRLRPYAVGILVISLLVLAYFALSPRVSAADNVATLIRYDTNASRFDVVSWPYFDRGQGCQVYESPRDQYPAYNWSGGMGIWPFPMPNGSNKYLWYVGYWGYFRYGSDEHGWTYNFAWFFKSADTSYIDCGELSYRNGGGAEGGTSYTYPEELSYPYGDYDVYPVYAGNGHWLRVREQTWPEGPHGDCEDYSYMSSVSLDGFDSVSAYYFHSHEVDFRGYIPSDSPAYIAYVPATSGCYSSGHYGYRLATASSDYPVSMSNILQILPDLCGHAVARLADGSYRPVIGYTIENGQAVLQLGDPVPFPSRAYWIPYEGELVCAISATTKAWDPWNRRVIDLGDTVPSVSNGWPYTYPLISFDGNTCVFAKSVYNLGRDRDGDHDNLPDFATGTSYMHWYELAPVRVNGIEFNSIPVVPKSSNRATLYFRLDYDVWPGASLSVQNILVTVDGQPVDVNITSLDQYIPYDFSYGNHDICYSFDVENGSDVDHYESCFTKHIGYAPWNVSFTYEYNGSSVALLASAEDDGRIVSYSWDISQDGNTLYRVTSDTPVLHYEFPGPGDYNVCLTVTDNDDVSVTTCGTLAINSKLVPSGVKFIDNYSYSVNPVPVSSSASVSSLSVAPVPVPVLALSSVAALAAIIVLLLGW